MNEVEELVKIEDMIYEVKGRQVMLDSDLAKLYQCKNGTKEINQAVKNNLEKFSERFSWKLSIEEVQEILGRYKNPRVFTEQGVAMLVTILKSKIATNISIQIMDVFVAMRKYIANNNYGERLNYIETKVIEHDAKFDQVFSKLENEKNTHIFFKGQIFDTYSLLVNLLNKAKEEIMIIDNYIDKNLLAILSKIDLPIFVITNRISKLDIEKYQKQYTNVFITISKIFHDRFIILDKQILIIVALLLKI